MIVHRISLPLSNAFLIRDKRNLLVDTGCRGDFESLCSRIEDLGVRLGSISAVVLTHVHFDHCGCAAELKKAGIPVIAAAGSCQNLSEGVQEGRNWFPGKSRLLTRVLKSLPQLSFPPVEADISVSGEMSLEDFGISGRLLETPGHTQSSLSVVLENHSACVGDLLMGGHLGLPPAWKPFHHPASADRLECVLQVSRLRKLGVTSFFVGHGDTLEDSAIDSWLKLNN